MRPARKRVRNASVPLKLLPEDPTLSEVACFAQQVCQPHAGQTLEARLMQFLVFRFGEDQAPAYYAAPEFQRLLKARRTGVRR